MVQSPYGIRSMILQNIDKEIAHAQAGMPARIVAKMNGLISPMLVEALYKASQAGVSIDLLVRGVCCLKPQVPGVSENIRVHSVVGQFLEHDRVYWFHNNGNDQVYISSADWMPRNMTQRIEQAVKIKQKSLLKRIILNLELYLSDNQQRWELDAEGNYHRVLSTAEDEKISAQNLLLEQLNFNQ